MTPLSKILGAAFLAALPLACPAKDPARRALAEGMRQFEAKAYDQAAKAFEQAAQAAPQQKLDPAVAHYDEATALLEGGEAQQAAEKYTAALRSTDLDLQGKAYFNRGNALAAMAGQEEQRGQLDMAGRALDEAVTMFENAILLMPRDADAKVNYELALKKKQELEQRKQQQQQQQGQEDQPKQDQQEQEQPKPQDQQQQPQDQEQKGQQPQPEEQKGQEPQQQKQPQPSQPSEAMTPQEAAVMLDAMKQEEQATRDRMRLVIGQPEPVQKDW